MEPTIPLLRMYFYLNSIMSTFYASHFFMRLELVYKGIIENSLKFKIKKPVEHSLTSFELMEVSHE